jgi:hypothetical protein
MTSGEWPLASRSASRSNNPQEGAFACKQEQKCINENNNTSRSK